MKVLYLDESGNHDLNPLTINPQYPIFAIGGAIVDRSHMRNVIEPQMRDFKLTHFGNDTVHLHTVDMNGGRGEYQFLANPAKRRNFYDDLNTLLSQWNYKVIVCVFEKYRYLNQGQPPADPYHTGVQIIIDRICAELGSRCDAGLIYAEKRNPKLDRELLLAWERFRRSGTDHVSPRSVDSKIVEFLLKDKGASLAGLQIADLVVTPVGRHVVGRPPLPNQVQWSVVEQKLRSVEGSYSGQGLLLFNLK